MKAYDLRRAIAGRPQSGPAAVAHPSLVGQLSMEEQWLRLGSIVRNSIEIAQSAADHHRQASEQLEAADYALHCLIGELKGVVAVTVTSPLAPAQVSAPEQARVADGSNTGESVANSVSLAA